MNSSDSDTQDAPESSPAVTPKMEDYLRRIYRRFKASASGLDPEGEADNA